MDWNKISETLDKEIESCASFPTDEHDRLVAKVWYWRGIANFAKLMAEDKEDNSDKGFIPMQSGKPA